MKSGKDIELYNKIDILCKRIDAYTTKAISVKSEVKNTKYIDKLTKLLDMINYEAGMQGYNLESKNNNTSLVQKIVDEVEQSDVEDKYNPNSENFCFKEKLEKNNGDVEALIEELHSEDKLGYRNAYIINEIKKTTDPENHVKKETLNDAPIPVENKNAFTELLNSMKNIINKIRGLFKGGNANKI